MSRDAALQIVRRLREHGHVAYFAGGCVRDKLLGIKPHDHDIATDAPPNVVQKIFRRTQPVGEAFGVVLVYPDSRNRGTKNAAGIEVATFRTEGVYSDGRRPDDVTFSTAQHDAQRRDFTINGLFEDPLHPAAVNPDADDDGVIDYVGGRADLQAQKLRAIGEPAQRFAEDYLRMLRAVRFTARLGFELDRPTAEAIRQHAHQLQHIARERIGDEVRAALTGPRPHRAAMLLQQLGLDGPALGEPASDVGLPTFKKLEATLGYAATLAAWLFDRRQPSPPQPADVARWRDALCLSNDETQTLGRILRHVRAAGTWQTLGIAARKRLLSSEDWPPAQGVLRALGRSQDIESDTPSLRGDGIGLAPAPLIGGADLIQLGLKPGPAFKTLLDGAYDAQLEGQLTDADQALAWVRQHHQP